jgi:predicted Zn-dependent protease
LGANGVFLKFSRSAESQADLMAEAGYDPVEMARFFDKLNGQGGGARGDVAQFFPTTPIRTTAKE